MANLLNCPKPPPLPAHARLVQFTRHGGSAVASEVAVLKHQAYVELQHRKSEQQAAYRRAHPPRSRQLPERVIALKDWTLEIPRLIPEPEKR